MDLPMASNLIAMASNLIEMVSNLFLEDLCWESLTEMPCSRDACAATALQGRVYVAGGRSSGHFLASADVLEGGATATVRWSRLPPMPTARLGCFAAAARSSVYVAGGHAGRGRALAIIERFDVAEYFWELLTNMPSARLGAVSLCRLEFQWFPISDGFWVHSSCTQLF